MDDLEKEKEQTRGAIRAIDSLITILSSEPEEYFKRITILELLKDFGMDLLNRLYRL